MTTANPSKVLVLDDEALIAFDLAETVADLGCKVVGPAITLKEGFELADAEEPDLALLDINIAGDVVWPLAAYLAEKGCDLVFISADVNHRKVCDKFSRSPLIEKPASPERIARAIEEARDMRVDA